ncbi:MAG: tRNA preQ1(34) S-adenosylmethionine ribosyltransferase-isomerase QueA [Deltaproteobacteria bacterium]|nr:tRNA preQ1(34) S-adenosylmethionine ribosyltransferase-isomerase QueA [Deltaproteobacteria bacterium]
MEHSIQSFDYHLPAGLVAQYPQQPRDRSRMLVLDRDKRCWYHTHFFDLPAWLDEGDLLVVNDTQVFPARLRGRKSSGGQIELLLLDLPVIQSNGPVPQVAQAQGWYRASRRLKTGQHLEFGDDLHAEVIAANGSRQIKVRFWTHNQDIREALQAAGEVPLPPYIRRAPEPEDSDRYQTIFAARPGAVAAPTAGLHFTPAILKALKQQGVDMVSLTLHVGPGTFQPVKQEDYTRHQLAPEYYQLSAEAAARINQARAAGKRLVAVGTTTVRVLESRTDQGVVKPGQGLCDLYIYPGYRFQLVDRLLTNFHLPRSTLLLLVSALASRELVLEAYQEAVAQQYRFYSYGDCMLIL